MSDLVQAAQQRLRQAIDRAKIARGEAQWTNGYRASAFNSERGPSAEAERLYQKEQEQWRRVSAAEVAVDRAITAYARSIRASTHKRVA